MKNEVKVRRYFHASMRSVNYRGMNGIQIQDMYTYRACIKRAMAHHRISAIGGEDCSINWRGVIRNTKSTLLWTIFLVVNFNNGRERACDYAKCNEGDFVIHPAAIFFVWN